MQFTLPYSRNLPPPSSKRPHDRLIARHNALKFSQPKLQAAFRRVGKFAPGMAMPKASVDENGYLLTRKHEIWFAEHARISPPASDAVLPKQGNHS
jgi:hypothetical protein